MTRTTVRFRRIAGPMLALATVASGALGLALPQAAGAAQAARETATSPSVTSFSFRTLDDHKDKTFNQLLSINDNGTIAGYFGIGTPAATHPNKGYVLHAPYGQNNYTNENFPGSQQTQVTGINLSGTTCGFYADPAGDNFGFVLKNGVWTAVIDPHTTGTTNQLLGLNNNGMAVGFYTDSKGHAHGYEFNFHTDTFSAINIPGASECHRHRHQRGRRRLRLLRQRQGQHGRLPAQGAQGDLVLRPGLHQHDGPRRQQLGQGRRHVCGHRHDRPRLHLVRRHAPHARRPARSRHDDDQWLERQGRHRRLLLSRRHRPRFPRRAELSY